MKRELTISRDGNVVFVDFRAQIDTTKPVVDALVYVTMLAVFCSACLMAAEAMLESFRR